VPRHAQQDGKYLAAAALAALAATGLTGCGGEESTPRTAEGGAPANPGKPGKKITLVQGLANEPFYISMQCGAQEEARKLGVDLKTSAPQQWDVAQQTQVVNSVAAARPDAVMIAPVNEKSMERPVRQLAQNGSKIVLVDTTLKDASIGESRISSDNRAGRVEAARALARLVGDKGKVLVLSVPPGTPTTDARIAGFRDELGRHPGVELVKVEHLDGSDAGKATSAVNAALAAHPDLAGIFAANVTTGQGAATALKNTGRTGKTKLVGFDASPKQVEDLKAGTVQALIAQQPLEIGAEGVRQAVAAIDGQSVRRQIQTRMVAVTKDNLDDPEVSRYLYRGSC
jgi:ribose transport system substrate-binding protein